MLPNNWIETEIGDQVTLQRGIDITRAEQRAGNIPVISSGGFSSYHDTAAVSGPGVVLGRKGVVGSVYYVEGDYWPHDTTLWVKDFHGNSPRFVYYFFKYLTPVITLMDVGSANPTLNRNHVHPLSTMWPPLPEQRAIAGILGALDDKIELNRRMNRTLESMARAVFRQWFVEGEEVASWKVGKLKDLCEPTIGGDWGEEQEFEDSMPVICLRGVDLDNLRKDGYSEDAPVRWIKKSSFEKRQLSDCDILIAGSGIGPVGKSLWVSPEMLKAYSYPVIYSNFVKRFRGKSPEYAVFVDRVLFNMRESNEIWDYVNGTSIPNLDDKGLLEYADVVIPLEDKVKAFYEYVAPIYAKLYNKESRTLASLRDGLLPRLMRGEVRVKDVEN